MKEIVLTIMWVGQACFVLRVGETTILMDPVPPRMGYSIQPVKADIVIISHEHGDHNYLGLAKGKPVVLRGLSEDKEGWSKIEFANDDVKITAFPSYHDNQKGAQRGKNTLFLIETLGLRILHTGDLGHLLPDETVRQIGKVDILMICVGGHYTIDADEARQVIAQLKPRVVMPMHYKTDPKARIPIAGVEEFLKGWEDVRRPKADRVAFTPNLDDYPEGKTTILVLPPQKSADEAQ